MKSVTILGIDPSTTHTGYALLVMEGSDVGIVYFDGKPFAGVVNLDTISGRERFTGMLIHCLIGCPGFLGVAIESTPFVVAHGRTEQQGARIQRGQTGAVGLARGFALAHGLMVLTGVNVSTAKAALANGRATKEQMIEAARLRFGVTLEEHAADACSVALAALKRYHTEQLRKQQPKLKAVARIEHV